MIKTLFRQLKLLTPSEKKLFERFYEIKLTEGYLKENQLFKNLGKQKIIIVKNKIFEEETIFNPQRKKRPKPLGKENWQGKDPFCQPKQLTPEDLFGRIETKNFITASNLAKFAPWHSVLIFKKHSIGRITPEMIKELITIFKLWKKEVQKYDQNIKNFYFLWNFHFRSGASILHPHFQFLAYQKPLIKPEKFIKKTKAYQAKFKSHLLKDLVLLHQKLGLAEKWKTLEIIIKLTPFKENEILVLIKKLSSPDFPNEFAKLLNRYKQIANSFNLFFIDYQPCFCFLVDRGSPQEKNSDIGAVEIYGASVVSSNPFLLAKKLFKN